MFIANGLNSSSKRAKEKEKRKQEIDHSYNMHNPKWMSILVCLDRFE
jgi:hypothetical protein